MWCVYVVCGVWWCVVSGAYVCVGVSECECVRECWCAVSE